MIVQGKDKTTGKFKAEVFDANNKLFATVEGEDYQAVKLEAHRVQRKALAPILSSQKFITDQDLALLEQLEL